MLTAYLMVADSGLTWTAETFYVAAAVIQLLLILLVFRVAGLSAEYNTFVGAIVVAAPVNALAYFTKDIELVGVIVPSVALFALLAMVARGDVIKATLAWVLVMASFLGLAKFVEPRAEDLTISNLGGIPEVLDAGGLTPKGFTEDDVKTLSGSSGDKDD